MSTNSYIICATPRSGSTLLCQLLESTGMLGHPESYFRYQDIEAKARAWCLPADDASPYGYTHYIDKTKAVGSTANGVFAVRVMWETMGELINELKKVQQSKSESDLLSETFGTVKYVYLTRTNTIEQAVSRLIAEQTNVWHSIENKAEAVIPAYDFERIKFYFDEVNQHNQQWLQWFDTQTIEPYAINYEALVAQPETAVRKMAEFVGVQLPSSVEITTQTKKMANERNVEWARRFQIDLEACTG